MTIVDFNSHMSILNNLLFGFALRLTGNKENAKDLMQETILRAYANRNKFTEGTNFKAWVTTIMRNCHINEYRKNKTRNKLNQMLGSNTIAVVKNSVNSIGPSIIMMKELGNMLNDLSEGNRIPFEMFFNGYEYNEIAEQLDIPIGTVKSRIFFARKKYPFKKIWYSLKTANTSDRIKL